MNFEEWWQEFLAFASATGFYAWWRRKFTEEDPDNPGKRRLVSKKRAERERDAIIEAYINEGRAEREANHELVAEFREAQASASQQFREFVAEQREQNATVNARLDEIFGRLDRGNL